MRLDEDFDETDDYGLLEEEAPQRNAFWRWLGHVFRERQVYLRSDGQVQFITLRPWLQISFAMIFAVGLFWLAYATVNVAFKDQLIALKERKSQYVRITYEDRLAAMRAALDGLNGKLLLDQEQYLRKVDGLKSGLDAVLERQQRIETFFKQGWMPARVMNGPDRDTTILPDQTPPAETDEGPLDSLIEPFNRNEEGNGKGDLELKEQSDLTTGSVNEERQSAISSTHFRTKYTQPFVTHDDARQPLSELDQMYADLNQRQIELLDEIDRLSDRRIQTASKAIRRIGLNPKTVVRNTRYRSANIGGPFINPKDPEFNDDIVGNKLLGIGRKIATYDKLAHAMKRMPLAYPMHGAFRITSGFGLRRDPFRRSRAMHAGIDLKAPYGHPVRATADGIVTKASWQGAYGRMVEIRHPHGITSRYAHLSRIKVKPGQRVKRGQKIGALGNTGRSTGAHVHYETRVYRRAISPRRFWKMREALQ
ncbi:MAG: M23 family metallopeptidase [Rhizobiales bacterium]|nr:M23 family metallopeptidase [Hyphomicrobiales bacterium]